MSPLEAQVTEAIAILEGGSDYERVHVAAILRNGLSALKEAPVVGQQWRPISEITSANTTRVLVTDGGFVTIDIPAPRSSRWIHWMPLPPAPSSGSGTT